MLLWIRELRPGGQDIPHNDKGKEDPAMAYNIEEWMWGMEKDAPKVEARSGNMINHRPE